MFRLDITSRNDLFSMCFCTLEHILIVMFELLFCYKLSHIQSSESEHLTWILIFSPLFAQCFMAMIVSVWCIRNEKTFEVIF